MFTEHQLHRFVQGAVKETKVNKARRLQIRHTHIIMTISALHILFEIYSSIGTEKFHIGGKKGK